MCTCFTDDMQGIPVPEQIHFPELGASRPSWRVGGREDTGLSRGRGRDSGAVPTDLQYHLRFRHSLGNHFGETAIKSPFNMNSISFERWGEKKTPGVCINPFTRPRSKRTFPQLFKEKGIGEVVRIDRPPRRRFTLNFGTNGWQIQQDGFQRMRVQKQL